MKKIRFYLTEIIWLLTLIVFTFAAPIVYLIEMIYKREKNKETFKEVYKTIFTEFCITLKAFKTGKRVY